MENTEQVLNETKKKKRKRNERILNGRFHIGEVKNENKLSTDL